MWDPSLGAPRAMRLHSCSRGLGWTFYLEPKNTPKDRHPTPTQTHPDQGGWVAIWMRPDTRCIHMCRWCVRTQHAMFRSHLGTSVKSEWTFNPPVLFSIVASLVLLHWFFGDRIGRHKSVKHLNCCWIDRNQHRVLHLPSQG